MTVYEHLDMFISLKNKGNKQDKDEIHRQEFDLVFYLCLEHLFKG